MELALICYTIGLFGETVILSEFQLTPPKPLKPRCHHSITATRVGPGLTEVLIFGGSRMPQPSAKDSIAETTILRFGENNRTPRAL